MQLRENRRSRRLLMLAVALGTPIAKAQTATWTGGGSTAAWDQIQFVNPTIVYPNWGNSTFDPGGANDVIFNSSFGSGNPFLDGSRSVKSVTINSTVPITFTGNTGNAFTFPLLTRSAAASATQTFSTIVNLSGATTAWNINGSGSVVMANAVGEAVAGSALTKNGPGLVTLGGGSSDTVSNTWTGATTISAGTMQLNKAAGTTAVPSTSIVINGGTLQLNNSNQINDSANLNIISGTLDLNGFSETIGGLSGGGTIVTGASTGALYVNQSTNTTAKPMFSGSGIFAKQGTGTLSINSAGGSLGGFECDAGTFNVSSTAITLDGGTILAVNGGTLNIQDSTTISYTGSATTAYVDSGGVINISGSHTTVNVPFQTLAGIGGTGTIVIDAATVNAATFLGASFASGSNGTMTIRNGAKVNVPNLFAGAKLGSSGTITVTGPGTSVTDTNYIGVGGSDSSAADTGGTGTLTVSNSASVTTPFLNFYSTAGSVVIDHGTIAAGQIQEFASGRISMSDGTAPALTLGTNNNTFSYAGTLSDYTSGPGSLTKVGGGTLTLTNTSNSFTGPLNINGGEVVTTFIASSGSPCPIGAGSAINFNGGTLEVTSQNLSFSDRTVSLSGTGGNIQVDGAVLLGTITGNAPFFKNGFGSLIVTGLSATSVSINAGSFTDDGGLTAASLTISSGATADIAAPATVSGALAVAGTLTLDSSLSVGQLTNIGQIQINNPFGALTFGTDGSTYTFAGQIRSSAGGTGAVTKTGAGSVTLTGANTYTGPTSVAAGTLVLNNSLSSTGAPVSIASGATLWASGFLPRQIRGAGALTAIGDLFVGDNSANGYSFGGGLTVGNNTVQLLATQTATLGTGTTIANGRLITTGSGGLINPGSLTVTGAASINGPVTNNGTVAATPLTASVAFDSDVTNNGALTGDFSFSKKLIVPLPGSIVFSSNITLASTSIMQQSNGSVSATKLQNQGQIQQSGGSSSFGQILGTGSIAISNGSLRTNLLQQTALSISGGGLSIGKTGSPSVNTLSSLSITGSGILDLRNNDLILSYIGHSPADDIRAYMASAFDNGAWDKPGLTSLTAASDTNFRTGVGYAEASQLGIANGGSFGGQTIPNQAIVVKYTYYGDNDLDGKVTLNDFSIFVDGFNGLGNGWVFGDYDYNGSVDLTDYQIFANAYASYQSNRVALSDLRSAILSNDLLTTSQKAAMLSSVPEPSSAMIFGALLAGSLQRRRRFALVAAARS